jgi:hypothetical protein
MVGIEFGIGVWTWWVLGRVGTGYGRLWIRVLGILVMEGIG